MDFSSTRALALNYHENSKFNREANSTTSAPSYKVYPNAKATPMDKNDFSALCQSEDRFLQALITRQSTRNFSSQYLKSDDVNRLLTLSLGRKNDYQESPSRTYPSVGACYPIEVYVVVLQSFDLELGIYHFNVKDNSLELLKEGDFSQKVHTFYSNHTIGSDVPYIVLFSLVFDRAFHYHGMRGYRYALMDAGCMSQNLYLIATYLNIGIIGLAQGSDNDDKLDDLVGLYSGHENIICGFALGGCL